MNIDKMIAANDDILSHNLYIYCSNNPVKYSDTGGESLAAVVGGAMLPALAPSIAPALETLTAVLIAGIITIGAMIVDAIVPKPKAIAPSTTSTYDPSEYHEETPHRHHIVAQRDHRAAPARDILKQTGIGIDSVSNTVMLPASYHHRIHTNRYYFKVNMLMILTYDKDGDKAKNVEQELKIIKEQIRNRLFVY